MNELEQARKIINAVDQQIAELFEQRMDAVKMVAAYKQANDLPIFDAAREQVLLENNLHYIKNKEYRDAYIKIQTMMMDVSKEAQTRIIGKQKVGYQGIVGAFSYIATTQLFPYGEWIQYATFEDIFVAVEQGELDYGVIPFENSYTGDVNDVMDMCRHHSCHIETIYPLSVEQNLLVQKGTKLEEITHVYSHVQALQQCSLFLKQRPWKLETYPNTAMAAAYVASLPDHHGAAIASKETAQLYGLDILQEHINTSRTNMTRFIVITKRPLQDAERFNMIFTIKHESGALAAIIDEIRDAGYNMECIKSYPQKDVPWAYYFYIEVVGRLHDEKTKELIHNIESRCLEFKVIGSYTIKQGGSL